MEPSLLRRILAAIAIAGGLFGLEASPLLAGGAKITIVIMDGANVGLNDPTPAAPVGGNPGTTLGVQRLNVFQAVADAWGQLLDSAVEIRIQASFTPLSCDATSAVLAMTGPIQVLRDFPGAQFPGTWYPVALANKQAGKDLTPGDPKTSADDIATFFNSDLGTSNCLAGIGWYYGLDNNHGNNTDLFTVLLHEYAHGFGFKTLVNLSSGAELQGKPDVFERNVFDVSAGKLWTAMTDSERAASILNARQVSWNGTQVTAAVPGTLAPGTPVLRVNSPSSVARDYSVGTALFGPLLTATGITGQVVQATDPADSSGPATTDACSPLTNASGVAGNIALVDRGSCPFVVKVKNCQNAGATAVLVADNVGDSPPAGLGGSDPSITIPAVRITMADGATLKASLASGVNVTVHLDPLLGIPGADPAGRALLYATNPIIGGSSISHWDTSDYPNLLLEPYISSNLKHDVDLTLPLLSDIGWFFAPPDCLNAPKPDQPCERSIVRAPRHGAPRAVKPPT